MRDQQVLDEVKSTLALLTAKAPGRAIEVRIPPYAAVQCGDGPTHTRGTPANVIEMNALTFSSQRIGGVCQHRTKLRGCRAAGVFSHRL